MIYGLLNHLFGLVGLGLAQFSGFLTFRILMLYKGVCFVLQGGLTLAQQNMIDPSTASPQINLNLV